MGNTNLITRQMAISATPEVWLKLERFFALLHFNGGHSGTFGMTFDGDGADCLRVDPPPREELRQPAQRIGGAGPELEIANSRSYVSKSCKNDRWYIIRGTDPELVRVEHRDGCEPMETVVRRYDR